MSLDTVQIPPAAAIRGVLRPPGDKSVSHRLVMLGAIAEGETTVRNFAESEDCQSTVRCLRDLGVPIEQTGSTVIVAGRGKQGLDAPARELDARNSGTTVRLLAGILAGCDFESTFVGDSSLSQRPMRRIVEPLNRFGASVSARDGNYLPLRIRGGPLTAIDYTPPVASAQVKSAVLLAGLSALGVTRVREIHPTRNHTEIALREFGAPIRIDNGVIEVEGGGILHGRTFQCPGDSSSAAFLAAAAAGLPGSRLLIEDVGLSPGRIGFFRFLEQMGGRIHIEPRATNGGEPAGSIVVESSELSGGELTAGAIPALIDEIPLLAVLALRTRDGIRVRDAAELRSKETDRIRAVVTNLRTLGAEVEEFPDGFFVSGRQRLLGGVVDSFGDHRIAMAFSIAGLFAAEPVTIRGASCVEISFRGFFDAVKEISR